MSVAVIVGMTRPEKAAAARVLRDQGLLLREIAEQMGCVSQTVGEWLRDPDGRALVARKDSYRQRCGCGALMDGSAGRSGGPSMCAACRKADVAENGQPRAGARAWGRRRILDAIRAWADLHGGDPPSAADWNPPLARLQGHPQTAQRFYDDGCWPHATTVLGAFGSWNVAIVAAGLTPRAPGIRRQRAAA